MTLNSHFYQLCDMKKMYLIAMIILSVLFAEAQKAPYQIFNGDTINRVDAKGLKQGEWRKYYRTDTLYSRTFFINNKPVGVTKTWYESGKIKGIVTFEKSGLKAHAVSYYESGKVLAKGNYIDQKKDSTWNFYSENDALKSIENYKNGIATGNWKVFFEDGKIAEEKNYLNGKREGIYRQFNADSASTLIFEMNYKNDLEDGVLKLYHLNGKVKETGSYIKGVKEGVWMEYDATGAILKTEIYKNGMLMTK